MKHKLTILVILVQILGVIFGVLLVFVGEKICMTTKCYDLSTSIKDYINDEIKPCEDFYTYACGNMLGDDKPAKGMVEKIGDALLKKIGNYLENVKEGSKPEAFTVAKQMYKQCMDRNESVPEIENNMFEFVQEAGGFPARDGKKWDEEHKDDEPGSFKLVDKLWALRKAGLSTSVFFSLTFKRSPAATSKYIMCISLPKPYVMFKPQFLATCGDDCKKAVLFVYKRILTLAGVKQNDLEKEAQELLDMDIKIANLTYKIIPTTPDVDRQNMMLLSTFSSTYDFFDWPTYINFMLSAVPNPGKTMPKGTMVIVQYPEYLAEIKSVIVNSTSKQLTNYVVWYNLLQFLYYPELPRTPTYCLDTFMEQTMPEILNALAARVEDTSTARAAFGVIKHIGSQLIREVKISTWVDEKTKAEALEKIENLEVKIGYSEIFLDDKLIDKYFNITHETVGKSFYHSYRNILQNKRNRETHCFYERFKDDLCQLMLYGELNILTAEMFYEPSQNEIVLANTFLLEPLFFTRWPEYMHFSRLGFLLSHEFVHIVDRIGSFYDKFGDIGDWWGNETLKNFQKKEKCFADQLGEFRFSNGVERETIPVNMSLVGTIADDGGLTTSFNAFHHLIKNRWVSVPKLPSLDYTPDQLFFITLTQFFCVQYKPFELPSAFYNVHAPNPIRVEEMLQNSRDFSKAFQCEEGSEMNPAEKCFLF